MLAQETKIVQGLLSTGLTTTGNGDWVNLGKYHHFTAIVDLHSTAGSATVRLQKATSSTGGGSTNVTNFLCWYNKNTTGGDTLTANGVSTGAVTISTGTAYDKMAVLEVDSSDIQGTAADYDFVRAVVYSTAAACTSVSYVLSDARYADAVPPTAIS